jgi:hypothetical protein
MRSQTLLGAADAIEDEQNVAQLEDTGLWHVK